MSDNRTDKLIFILSETIRILEMTLDEREQWLSSRSDGFIVPRLPTPSGAALLTTMDAETAIRELAVELSQDVEPSHDHSRILAFDAAIRRFCGEVLATQSLAGHSVEQMSAMMSMYVKMRVTAPATQWAHYVPCMLSEESYAPSFSIGPVNFAHLTPMQPLKGVGDLPCSQWINAANGSQGEKSWMTLDGSLAGANWLAWVLDSSSDYEASKETAVIHVEFAIYILQLVFDTEATRTFRHKWERRPPPMIQRLSHRVGHDLLLKLQRMPEAGSPNLSAFGSEWIHRQRELLARAGRRISAVSSPAEESSCPIISERWLTALYWFGRSLRESLDSAAVIALGAALDIFGRSSGKTPQMVEFCSGLLSIGESEVVYGSDITLKAMVELIYADGRSQLIHGGKPVLKNDYSMMRQLSEAFVRVILLRSLDRIDLYCLERASKPQIRDSFDDFVRMVSSAKKR